MGKYSAFIDVRGKTQVLDQVEETVVKSQPKSTGTAAGMDGTTRHLAHDELESYASGRLPAARLDYCQTHLESCDACRAELEDIRTFAAEMAGFARTESDPRALGRRKRKSAVSLPVVASGAVVVIATVAAILWWRHGGLHGNAASGAVGSASPVAAQRQVVPLPPVAQPTATSAPVVQTPVRQSAAAPAPVAQLPVRQSAVAPAPVAQLPVRQSAAAQAPTPLSSAPQRPALARTQPTAPAAGTPPRTPSLAEDIAALPDDVRSTVSDAIQHGKLQLPPDVTRLHGRVAPSSSAAEGSKAFALLGPFGEAISDTRPEFTWQPLPGALKYSVAIVDTGLHPVQHSHALHAMSWRPKRPLRRGRTYLWQVTATLRGGSKVVAAAPSPSQTLLRVIPSKTADEIAHFRKSHPDAHLVTGALYAQAGMLSESAEELKKVAPGDPSYNTAQKLLNSL